MQVQCTYKKHLPIYDRRNNLNTVMECVCNKLTRCIYRHSTMYKKYKDRLKRLNFIIHLILSDMKEEKIYMNPFRPVTWKLN